MELDVAKVIDETLVEEQGCEDGTCCDCDSLWDAVKENKQDD